MFYTFCFILSFRSVSSECQCLSIGYIQAFFTFMLLRDTMNFLVLNVLYMACFCSFLCSMTYSFSKSFLEFLLKSLLNELGDRLVRESWVIRGVLSGCLAGSIHVHFVDQVLWRFLHVFFSWYFSERGFIITDTKCNMYFCFQIVWPNTEVLDTSMQKVCFFKKKCRLSFGILRSNNLKSPHGKSAYEGLIVLHFLQTIAKGQHIVLSENAILTLKCTESQLMMLQEHALEI